ncbi:hypothetical protein [Streptomyces sp. NPDC088775]|uniref:hypothetical protein n=1 Tax=Streptomyces sp. NPDC088775 TaxID=3365896 RepID=UPI003804618E
MVPQIETQAMDRSVLAGALDAVQGDSPAQQTVVVGNVQASLTDANSCMMGGWTS